MHDDAVQRLEKELGDLPDLRAVDLVWLSPNELTVKVVITPRWHTRDAVIEVVDEFARENIETLSVDLNIVGAEQQ